MTTQNLSDLIFIVLLIFMVICFTAGLLCPRLNNLEREADNRLEGFSIEGTTTGRTSSSSLNESNSPKDGNVDDFDDDGDEPEWIVNNLGELGVIVNGRAFFLYKGYSLEYRDSALDMLYRVVGKVEFGEVCRPQAFYETAGAVVKGKYVLTGTFIEGLSDGSPEDHDWKPLSTLTKKV